MVDVEHDSHELAWAAGLADGEAWFGIAKGPPWTPSVQIGQKHRGVLDRFQRAVGAGRVSGPYGTGPNPMYSYHAAGDTARPVMSLLLPWLSEVKLEQIDRTRVRCADWRAIHPSRAQGLKTHCPQGHPYDAANTYRSKRGRHCRPCGVEKARERRSTVEGRERINAARRAGRAARKNALQNQLPMGWVDHGE